MKPTLTTLIKSAIAAEQVCQYEENDLGVVLPETQEKATLANNALEEKIQELIEAKVTQMLKERA